MQLMYRIFDGNLINVFKLGRKKMHWLASIFLFFALSACGPNEKERAVIAEQEHIECLDKSCDGDVRPQHDWKTETVLKVNGKWFIAPRTYYSGQRGAIFYWPTKAPGFSVGEFKEQIQGKDFTDIAIELMFRSNNIPPEPRGYKLIKLAEKNDWIASRKTIRRGLDAITMKHVIGPSGYYLDHRTYYVATMQTDPDGFPPVGACNHDHPMNGGGTGFIWRPGIWVGVRMNQKHCVDWPEIYQEITRVLSLLRKV
jgi:hypothetical protein